MIQKITNTLYNGLTLNRFYDDLKGSVDTQCRSLSWWNQVFKEMEFGLEYYWFGTSHKFFSKLKGVNIYSLEVSFPNPEIAEAYCYDRGNCTSEIFMKNFKEENRVKGAISHEMGHAYHNWCEVFSHASVFAEFSPFWERQFSANDSTFNADAKPWDDPWNCNCRDENVLEQFANAWRCYFGTNSERGSSGAGTDDPVVPGFEDPKLNQQWCTMMKLLPETCAMIKSYGIRKGSLQWPYGTYGGFVFTTNELIPRTVCHWFDNSNMAVWYEVKNNAWVRWYPSYNRV